MKLQLVYNAKKTDFPSIQDYWDNVSHFNCVVSLSEFSAADLLMSLRVFKPMMIFFVIKCYIPNNLSLTRQSAAAHTADKSCPWKAGYISQGWKHESKLFLIVNMLSDL